MIFYIRNELNILKKYGERNTKSFSVMFIVIYTKRKKVTLKIKRKQ